jgi:RNA polymerase sigma factor (sigma-70 family)
MGVTLPAFQTLIDAYWRDVARLAHALVGPVDGDDVAQQAWTQALAAYPTLRSAANLRAWLLTITHRAAMDAHRRRARQAVPHDDVGRLAETSLNGASPGPEAMLRDDALWSKVAALPERQRHAIALRFVADLDHAGIARTLHISSAMSRRLVSDALATLRKDLT